MNTKTYLSQLWNIDKRIKDKLSEADKWMEIAYGRSIGKSKEIKHDTIQTSHEPDKIADAVVKSIDYYHEAVELSKDMVEKKHTIEKQITVSSSVISVWDNMVPFSLYNLKAFMSREGLENIKESIIPVFADISHKIIKEARRTILNK